MPKCPKCRSAQAVQGTDLRYVDTVLKYVRIFPFHCERCQKRFHWFS